MKLLVPLAMLLVGTGAGVGAGLFLAPPPEEVPCEGDACEKDAAGKDAHAPEGESEGHGEQASPDGLEYVKLRNQFIVPVVREERVSSVVVLSVSLEMDLGTQETVFAREPKLRDVFLAVLFDHAFIGGFEGAFTESERMTILKTSLFEAAKGVLGDQVHGVLVTDIARQEM